MKLSNRKKLEKLRAMRGVLIPKADRSIFASEDGQIQHGISIAEAAIVLDALLSDVFTPDGITLPSDKGTDADRRAHHRLNRTRDILTGHAVKIAKLENARRIPKGVRPARLNAGLICTSQLVRHPRSKASVTDYTGYEWNYRCLFCDEDLHTQAQRKPGERRANYAVTAWPRVYKHVGICAMRLLIKLAEEQAERQALAANVAAWASNPNYVSAVPDDDGSRRVVTGQRRVFAARGRTQKVSPEGTSGVGPPRQSG